MGFSGRGSGYSPAGSVWLGVFLTQQSDSIFAHVKKKKRQKKKGKLGHLELWDGIHRHPCSGPSTFLTWRAGYGCAIPTLRDSSHSMTTKLHQLLEPSLTRECSSLLPSISHGHFHQPEVPPGRFPWPYQIDTNDCRICRAEETQLSSRQRVLQRGLAAVGDDYYH